MGQSPERDTQVDGHELKTGHHYWFRQTVEMIWRVCYIGEDHDGQQWLHAIDREPNKIFLMDLSQFDFVELESPVELTKDGLSQIRNQAM